MAKRSRAVHGAAASPAATGDHGTASENSQAAGSGALLPLDYMLQVLRDPEASPAERKWAAEKAAPYLHPRLQTIEHSGTAQLRHEDALEDLA